MLLSLLHRHGTSPALDLVTLVTTLEEKAAKPQTKCRAKETTSSKFKQFSSWLSVSCSSHGSLPIDMFKYKPVLPICTLTCRCETLLKFKP